jgi:hypothetical protein
MVATATFLVRVVYWTGKEVYWLKQSLVSPWNRNRGRLLSYGLETYIYSVFSFSLVLSSRRVGSA